MLIVHIPLVLYFRFSFVEVHSFLSFNRRSQSSRTVSQLSDFSCGPFCYGQFSGQFFRNTFYRLHVDHFCFLRRATPASCGHVRYRISGRSVVCSLKMNIFRLVGDLSHLLAIIVLLLKIWKTRSCAGQFCLNSGSLILCR
jgi:hypothetical protein